MSNARVKISDISEEIGRLVGVYVEKVDEGVQKEAKKIANETKKEIQSQSPTDTAEYKKGWKVKKVGQTFVVHNSSKPFLTHLTENGHAKVSGGRVSGTPHIRPAEQHAIQKFEQAVEDVIRES